MVKEVFDMERLAEMKAYIFPKWNERLNKDMSKVQTYYNKNQREILLEFRNYIDNNLISKKKGYLSLEEQGDQLFLIISYLHSSLLIRSYEYEFSLCNELLFADRNKITAYWYPEFLYQYASDQEDFLQKELQKKFIRIKKYETETLRRDLFSSYWNIAKGYFKDLTASIGEKEKIQIYYGEHMGELTELL